MKVIFWQTFVNILTFSSLRQQTELRLLLGCFDEQTEGLLVFFRAAVHGFFRGENEYLEFSRSENAPQSAV